MQYTLLGNTGLTVSRLAFGAMTFTAGNKSLGAVSKVGAELAGQLVDGLSPFTDGQMYYSLVGRDVERDIIPMMRRYGLGLTVWSPLVSGFLSGKYTRQTLSDPNNRLSGFDILPFDKEQGFKLVDRMRPIAAACGASVAQVAIAWLLARPAVSGVIVGSTRLSQLEDNLQAAAVTLTAAQIAELDAATPLPPVYPNFFTDDIAVDPPLAQALSQVDR